MRKSDIFSFLLTLILTSLAIAPAFVLGDQNRNLLLIGLMVFSPLLILFSRKLYLSDVWLFLFLIGIMFSPLLHQPSSMRWSTVLYSILFGLLYLAYEGLLARGHFSISSYEKVLKRLIFAYFVVLLIQQFCVLTGLPVFNVSNYSSEQPWKLNALSSEPSHTARITALLMYSYLAIVEVVRKRKYNFQLDIANDKWMWLAFLWVMLTMQSATAFVFIPIILVKFVRPRNIFPLIAMLGVIGMAVFAMELDSLERAGRVLLATLTFDHMAIIHADHSASQRIAPLIVLLNMVDISSLDGYFGHGIDSVTTFMSQYIPGVKQGYAGGGLVRLWYEYGFLAFVAFLIFSFSRCVNVRDYTSVIFWLLLVFMYGVNSQIVWLCIVLLFTNKYFLKRDTGDIDGHVEKVRVSENRKGQT